MLRQYVFAESEEIKEDVPKMKPTLLCFGSSGKNKTKNTTATNKTKTK